VDIYYTYLSLFTQGGRGEKGGKRKFEKEKKKRGSSPSIHFKTLSIQPQEGKRKKKGGKGAGWQKILKSLI